MKNGSSLLTKYIAYKKFKWKLINSKINSKYVQISRNSTIVLINSIVFAKLYKKIQHIFD